MIKKEGYWWPDEDTIAFGDIKAGLPFLKKAVSYCKEFRTAVQAGGNAGMYPAYLLTEFDHVVSAEPEARNYACLCRNAKSALNIHAAFGEKPGKCGLTGWEPNMGCWRTESGGDIPVVTIDSLSLSGVDFIQLDVEGDELSALKGAEETILRDHPVIMIEERGHGPSPAKWLHDMGYRTAEANKTDTIWL